MPLVDCVCFMHRLYASCIGRQSTTPNILLQPNGVMVLWAILKTKESVDLVFTCVACVSLLLLIASMQSRKCVINSNLGVTNFSDLQTRGTCE